MFYENFMWDIEKKRRRERVIEKRKIKNKIREYVKLSWEKTGVL